MATIPFDDIVPGATVRYTLVAHAIYLSVRDVIMHISRITGKRANEVWRMLTVQQRGELAKDLAEYHFSGQGQSRQPIITVDGAMKLMMMLPGKHAKSVRVQAADILSRYINGNESLVEEVYQNKMMGPAAACSKLLEKAEGNAYHNQEMPPVSYVYGTKSDAFPNLIKIGRTSNVSARLSSLNTGCAPNPHYTVAVAPTFNASRDEALAHTFFAHARREGEFFEVTVQEVKTFFANHILSQYQVELAECIAKTQGDL